MTLDEIRVGLRCRVIANPAMGHTEPIPIRVVKIDPDEMYPVIGETRNGTRLALEPSELEPVAREGER